MYVGTNIITLYRVYRVYMFIIVKDSMVLPIYIHGNTVRSPTTYFSVFSHLSFVLQRD